MGGQRGGGWGQRGRKRGTKGGRGGCDRDIWPRLPVPHYHKVLAPKGLCIKMQLKVFPNTLYERNIKTLSQLEAEIQPVARLVATEQKFVTGCQGNACLTTKL